MGVVIAKSPVAPKASSIGFTDICCAATLTSSASLLSQTVSTDVPVYSDAAPRELPSEEKRKIIELRSVRAVDSKRWPAAPIEVAHSEPQDNTYSTSIQTVGTDATPSDCSNIETSSPVDQALKEHDHFWKGAETDTTSVHCHTGETSIPVDQTSKKHDHSWKLKCIWCDFRAGEISSLRCHQRETHEVFECRTCEEPFHGYIGLRRHQGRMHKSEEYFVVDLRPDCQIWELRRQKGAPTRFYCKPCESSFTQLRFLEQHLYRHQGRKWPCKFCRCEYGSQNSLTKHVNKKHSCKAKRHKARSKFGTQKTLGGKNTKSSEIVISGSFHSVSPSGTTQDKLGTSGSSQMVPHSCATQAFRAKSDISESSQTAPHFDTTEASQIKTGNSSISQTVPQTAQRFQDKGRRRKSVPRKNFTRPVLVSPFDFESTLLSLEAARE